MEFWLVVILVVLVLAVTVSYFVLMAFFPEWVGITGKKALEAQDSHKGESSEKPQDS